jgi:hypothetical protein
MRNIMQSTQARSLSNSEVDTKSLTRREMAFLKHSAERLGEIIVQGSSGPLIIVELSFPVHEMLVPFLDCR